MAYTAARVLNGGLQYRIIGAQKETITDVTITAYTAAGEPITAADLGLARLDDAEAKIQSSAATGTGVEAAVVAGPKLKVNLATGADATVPNPTVIRVRARGAGS